MFSFICFIQNQGYKGLCLKLALLEPCQFEEKISKPWVPEATPRDCFVLKNVRNHMVKHHHCAIDFEDLMFMDHVITQFSLTSLLPVHNTIIRISYFYFSKN